MTYNLSHYKPHLNFLNFETVLKNDLINNVQHRVNLTPTKTTLVNCPRKKSKKITFKVSSELSLNQIYASK